MKGEDIFIDQKTNVTKTYKLIYRFTVIPVKNPGRCACVRRGNAKGQE